MPHFNSHTEEKHNLFYNLVVEMMPCFTEAVADTSTNDSTTSLLRVTNVRMGVSRSSKLRLYFVGEVMYRREF